MTTPPNNTPDPIQTTDDSQRPRLHLASEKVEADFAHKMRELQLAEEEKDIAAKAEAAGLPYINLSTFAILPEAIGSISEDTARAAKAVCFSRQDDDLRLATTEPDSASLSALTADLTRQAYRLTVYLVSPHSLEQALRFYKAIPKIKKVARGIAITGTDLERFQGQFKTLPELTNQIRKVSVTDLVTFLVASAIESRASDIHIEAEEKGIIVRYRIDGVLHEIVDLPIDVWKKLASRIKLIAKLKINILDRPQDGSFTIQLDNDKIDVRVSTIPTNYGESIVMRLLMSSASAITFDDLGLRGKAYADLDREIGKPNGMIITTGPTGSGKTTTLYAVLNKLNNPETKIITLEDPIEYKLAGINQSQIQTDKGYGFAVGLRSILRQDPDIIMVGEIRDLETAETAINAALTGHLVVSTLHTNSAAATIPRFLSMEVKPFLLAPALNAMIGQRLVRKICPDCKTDTETDSRTMSEVIKALSSLSPESGEKSHIQDVNNLKFYQGAGCAACQGLGYKGRIGIYEIMTMNKEIENLILAGQVSEYQMQDIGVKNGMVTMLQDGLLKAVDGITTVDEVFRVAKE
ncbi:type II/IV secretion system protein [Candidatus Falkowbacteria bacterium]|nr:type II/IV secretion system protein [Candidatus Falkowbacteria bacterium]